MYYRLTYSNNEENEVKEFSTSRERAELEAGFLLNNHGQIGKVVVESRASEYYGDYRHVLTIENTGIPVKQDPDEAPNLCYTGNPNSRWSNELHPFLQHKLEEESIDIQRLMWICQVKGSTLHQGKTRSIFCSKRDEQVAIIEGSGKTFEEIKMIAGVYKCKDELVSD